MGLQSRVLILSMAASEPAVSLRNFKAKKNGSQWIGAGGGEERDDRRGREEGWKRERTCVLVGGKQESEKLRGGWRHRGKEGEAERRRRAVISGWMNKQKLLETGEVGA